MITVRKLWENSNITDRYPGLAFRSRFDEPMSAHTTFRVGGPADLLVSPASVDELCAIINLFNDSPIPVSILGGGSNLLVSDRGIRGVVVSLDELHSIERLKPDQLSPDQQSAGTSLSEKIVVRSGAGASMNQLTDWCAEQSLSGLERFAGLPGSVGGAAFMNARCYELSVSDVFFSAEVLSFRGGSCIIEEICYDLDDWDYKKSPFQDKNSADSLLFGENDRIILSVSFSLGSGNAEQIRKEMNTYITDREEKGHFKFPSAGSMFKNNRAFGMPSGKIIDEAGLRGYQVGDAQVAPWHGNIIINRGNARAEDLRLLVTNIQKQVFDKTGFLLEKEVIFAGEW